MGLPRKLLGEGERVQVQVRTHAKAMVWPAIGLIVVAAAVGAGTAIVPPSYSPIGQYVVIIVAAVLVIWWSVLPFLRWRTTTYTVTDRRLITRSGILTKTGRDLPLIRVNDVSYERSLTDRIFGCGTLNIQTASEDGVIVLDDVPDVQHVHLILSELIFGETHAERSDPAVSDHGA